VLVPDGVILREPDRPLPGRACLASNHRLR
jgi:hypothetical protein